MTKNDLLYSLENYIQYFIITYKVRESEKIDVYVYIYLGFTVQFSSVAQLCPTPCSPMNCSTPGLPVHHQLPEFTQTHVHQVDDKGEKHEVKATEI